MIFKFNGGRGAILCGRCGKILKAGSEIPEYVLEAVKNGTVNELPDMFCEDNCEASKRVLEKIHNNLYGEKQTKTQPR